MKYFVQKVNNVFACIKHPKYNNLKVIPEPWVDGYHGRLVLETCASKPWTSMYIFPSFILYDENNISFMSERFSVAGDTVLTLNKLNIKNINCDVFAHGDLYSLYFTVDVNGIDTIIEMNFGKVRFQDFCDAFENFSPVKDMLLKLIM